jgi:zinc protease
MKRFLPPFLRASLAGLFAVALLLSGPARSQSSASGVTAQSFTLSNGMTLIVQPDRRAPTVAHMLWVRVGSMDEVDGTSGVAHVLEHMMFKGTPRLQPGEFSRRVAALGGRENAFTSRDATAYHQQVPSQHLEAVMRLEADRFAHNLWDDSEFQREIEVIKEERRQRVEESPRARMFEAFNAMNFLASPYRRPVIGWMSDIEAMTPQDVRDFYQRWYVPANAAVVVAGDVDVAAVRALAENIYGAIAARPVPARKPRLEPEQMGPRRMEYRATTEQSLVALAYPVPGLRSLEGRDQQSQDALALTVLSAVLDGYSGARLERALVQGGDRPRLADSAGASVGLLGRGPRQFVLTAVPAPGVEAEAVAQALKDEVGRIAREGISDTELQRVKTQWAAAEIYKRDSVFNQAQELGTYWINGWEVQSGDRLMARLRAVTAEQVRDVALRHFSDDRLSTAVLVPDPGRRAPPPTVGPRPVLGRH